jgi:hypothetical protein
MLNDKSRLDLCSPCIGGRFDSAAVMTLFLLRLVPDNFVSSFVVRRGDQLVAQLSELTVQHKEGAGL